MIYVLASSDQTCVKIGFSGKLDPVERCEEIEQAHPERLVLLLLLRGDKRVERQLHERFVTSRMPARREWFQLGREIEDWLRAEAGVVAQPFYEWLLRRRNDEDLIGSFARDATEAKNFPRGAKSFFAVDGYLRDSGVSSEAHAAFKEAWRDFLRDEAKKEPAPDPIDVADDGGLDRSILKNAADLFDRLLPEALTRSPERARALDTILCFKIEGGGDWTIDCSQDAPSPTCTRGISEKALCTVEIRSGDFLAMFSDPNVGMQLYFQKKLRLSGDSAHALKIVLLFELAQAFSSSP